MPPPSPRRGGGPGAGGGGGSTAGGRGPDTQPLDPMNATEQRLRRLIVQSKPTLALQQFPGVVESRGGDQLSAEISAARAYEQQLLNHEVRQIESDEQLHLVENSRNQLNEERRRLAAVQQRLKFNSQHRFQREFMAARELEKQKLAQELKFVMAVEKNKLLSNRDKLEEDFQARKLREFSIKLDNDLAAYEDTARRREDGYLGQMAASGSGDYFSSESQGGTEEDEDDAFFRPPPGVGMGSHPAIPDRRPPAFPPQSAPPRPSAKPLQPREDLVGMLRTHDWSPRGDPSFTEGPPTSEYGYYEHSPKFERHRSPSPDRDEFRPAINPTSRVIMEKKRREFKDENPDIPSDVFQRLYPNTQINLWANALA